MSEDVIKRYMTCGNKIIKSLGKRGKRGFYFTYSQYKELSKIQTFEDAKKKIVSWGFVEVEKSEDIESLVDNLKLAQSMTEEEKSLLQLIIVEPIFWILLAFSGCS